MSDLTLFSKRLKEARVKAGLTQNELSKISNVTAATISTYESEGNIKTPALDKVMNIAETLNISLDWLCGKNVENKDMDFQKVMDAFILVCSLDAAKIRLDKLYDDEGSIYAILHVYLWTARFLKNSY